MIHVQELDSLQLEKSSIVAIGVFDGVHVGHQKLVQQLVADAHANNRLAVVLTFHPHPDVVLKQIEDRYYLTSPAQRATLLGQMGVDVVVTHPFTDDIREIRAEDFVDSLLKHLKMVDLRVGKDFALGFQREGNVEYLTQLGAEKGYNVHPIDLVMLNGNGEHISSSVIREFLQEGNVEKAAAFLGRSYQVEGKVVKGDQRGRTIGFPTANLAVWAQQVLPVHGVYAGWATVRGETFMAVANVGVRPTFEGTTLTVEPHLLDFDRDIYGETLSLTFEHRLRGEQKFDGLEALKAQLNMDIAQGRELLSGGSG